MRKLRILLAFGILAILMFSLTSVLAYNHATFELSDRIVYNSDTKGENRGFSLSRSTTVPRLTYQGYYDWSAYPDPRNVRYPNPDRYKISDRLASEAFSTFRQDSQAQNTLEQIKERNRRFFSFGFRPRYYGGFGGYSGGSYGGYYGSSYYPRSYGSYGSYRYGF